MMYTYFLYYTVMIYLTLLCILELLSVYIKRGMQLNIYYLHKKIGNINFLPI